jgi:hypothetical protein
MILSVLFLCSATVHAHQAKTEDTPLHVDPVGKFSFVPPKDWKSMEMPGAKFLVVRGAPKDGFTPNIYVSDEAFKGTLKEYADASEVGLRQILTKYRHIKREDFKTTDGLPGLRFIIEHELLGKLLRQSGYIFENQGRMFVIMCSSLADGGEAMDTVFEASAKTFRFEKK